jgi:hypothetical protein
MIGLGVGRTTAPLTGRTDSAEGEEGGVGRPASR